MHFRLEDTSFLPFPCPLFSSPACHQVVPAPPRADHEHHLRDLRGPPRLQPAVAAGAADLRGGGAAGGAAAEVLPLAAGHALGKRGGGKVLEEDEGGGMEAEGGRGRKRR